MRHDSQRPEAALLARFERGGCARVETAILQPADLFVDLSGEDIRRRLFLTHDAEGRELCLRPEYTIPVCRQHLAERSGPRDYCYLGPVFRQRPGETGEFLQAGIESIGRRDLGPADVDALALALDGLRLFGERPFDVRIGDMGLLHALLEALEIAAPTRRRLIRVLAAGRGIAEALEPTAPAAGADYAGLLAAIEGQNPAAARAFVEDVISIAGIASVGGRSAGEIAERFLSRAENRSSALSDRARAVLGEYIAVTGHPDQAAASIRVLARREGLDLDAALERLEERTGFMAARGLDLAQIRFAANFVRGLDYYTGFIFEIRDPVREDGRIVVGGGRYDRLLSQLGAAKPLPAVGCAFWLDRLKGSSS